MFLPTVTSALSSVGSIESTSRPTAPRTRSTTPPPPCRSVARPEASRIAWPASSDCAGLPKRIRGSTSSSGRPWRDQKPICGSLAGPVIWMPPVTPFSSACRRTSRRGSISGPPGKRTIPRSRSNCVPISESPPRTRSMVPVMSGRAAVPPTSRPIDHSLSSPRPRTKTSRSARTAMSSPIAPPAGSSSSGSGAPLIRTSPSVATEGGVALTRRISARSTSTRPVTSKSVRAPAAAMSRLTRAVASSRRTSTAPALVTCASSRSGASASSASTRPSAPSIALASSRSVSTPSISEASVRSVRIVPMSRFS